MTTPRPFAQGEIVFDDEGKSGEVSQAFFDFDGGLWVYEVEGLGTVAEDFLSKESPTIDIAVSEEPPVDPIDSGLDETDTSGFPLPEEIDIGTARDVSGYLVPSSGLSREDVESIVRSWVNVHRLEVDNALRALESNMEVLDSLTSEIDSLRDSISRLVIEQSNIEDRRQVDQDALEEVEQTSLGGFIRNVGGFLLSPFDRIRDALEQYILGEVRDGLNR